MDEISGIAPRSLHPDLSANACHDAAAVYEAGSKEPRAAPAETHVAGADTLQRQNEALKQALMESEASKSLYTYLYEHAPIGYLTLDEQGMILSINNTGATLLGEEPLALLHTRFAAFVAKREQVRYDQMLEASSFYGGVQSLDLELERRDGQVFHSQVGYALTPVAGVQIGAWVTLIDITQRKAAEAEITHLAFFDALTSLPNRRLLLMRLQHVLEACAKTQKYGAIFFLDLDDFKTLNDTQGHGVGDLLLQQIADRLTRTIGDVATVARLGGDEFVILLQQLSTDLYEAVAETRAVGEQILRIFREEFNLSGYRHRNSGSVGATLFNNNETPVTDLFKRADLALYRAKASGRNTLCFFDPDMQAAVTARGVLDAQLRRALVEDQLVLYYQSQVDYLGHVTGAEALLRWQHPLRGIVQPADFIAFAEEKGLIRQIGRRVLTMACHQLQLWSKDSAKSHLTLAINVSAQEFAHPDFASDTLAIIDRARIDPRKLVLEFTESLLLPSAKETIPKMQKLRERGVRFSLDDFGIGYSSLVYLQSLPLDQLKIDRTFVRDVLTNSNDAAIARAVIALGQSLNLVVIAEGVEKQEQLRFLAYHGCLAYQGFLFGVPATADSFLTLTNTGAFPGYSTLLEV